MSIEKAKREWQQTSMISSILINANRAKGRPPVKPDDLNPYSEKHQVPAKSPLSIPSEASKIALAKMLGVKE